MSNSPNTKAEIIIVIPGSTGIVASLHQAGGFGLSHGELLLSGGITD
jgi:hypothetical protein